MSAKEFNQVFAKRLRHYLDANDMTQSDLAKKLGVGTTSVYNWCNGLKSPRMDKVDAMCEIFHCRRSDLIADAEGEDDHAGLHVYYFDPKTAAIAQEIHDNRQMQILFDAARDATPEQLRAVQALIRGFKEDAEGGRDDGNQGGWTE